MDTVPIIIPAYEPDERLLDLLEKLRSKKFGGVVIIVNDGSGREYDDIFERAELLVRNMNGCILKHKINRGKGRALKTAFSYILENDYQVMGVVTADSDGQHTPESIFKIIDAMKQNKEALVLGVRNFNVDGIPWKSRFGNNLTESVFRYVSGIHVSDTQTGLRGIPLHFMRELLSVEGERFEFEMRMLIEAAEKVEIIEIPIETIYDSEKNHQTHFDPFKDSIRIYRILGERFFKFIFSSLSSSIVDLILFFFFCLLLKRKYPISYAGIATVAARTISAIYNYVINYKIVFKSKARIISAGKKYALLAITQMLCSAIVITVLVKICPSCQEVCLKVIVDMILFFISYKVQQKLVFHS